MAAAVADILERRSTSGTASVSLANEPAKTARLAAADDAEGDGEAVTVSVAQARGDENVAAPFDDDGPVWPSEAAESAFLSEEKAQGRAAPRAGAQTLRQAAEDEESALGPLPNLEALIARIPANAREMLEDLFRPKFTGVKRVRSDVLK